MSKKIQGNIEVSGRATAGTAWNIPDWDNLVPYLEGDIVSNGNNIYRRIADGTSYNMFGGSEQALWSKLAAGIPDMHYGTQTGTSAGFEEWTGGVWRQVDLGENSGQRGINNMFNNEWLIVQDGYYEVVAYIQVYRNQEFADIEIGLTVDSSFVYTFNEVHVTTVRDTNIIAPFGVRFFAAGEKIAFHVKPSVTIASADIYGGSFVVKQIK
ncbi:MAG: hypothetical protein JRE40_14050 [Deltaproteobacteria bacterium]|nr:hypothetical protein [Deltaproteobacteria bacterium]